MEFSVSGITGGSSSNETFGYTVTSSSGGIYDATVNATSSSSSYGVSFVVDSNNNTVLSVTVSGYTVTGSQAKTEFDAFMALFGLEYTYGDYLNVYTDSTYFHSTGTASMTFGTVTFPVTTYAANTIPLTVNECGVSATITAFTLQVGTPPGTSLEFITLLHFASSAPTAEDITFQLVSMTVG